MQLEISVLSRPGARPVNEDACGYWSAPGACFCVVSDGAGGHRGGDVASKVVVSRVLGWFREVPSCAPETIARALRAANDALVAEQRRDARFADMRATAVVLAIDTEFGTASWGHLGDSRLYCFRSGRIVARTRDHSVAQRMIDTGYVSEDHFRGSAQRARLLAALGDPEECEPAIAPAPFPVRHGDAFLLCTDGCWDTVADEELAAGLARASTAGAWLQWLEDRIIASASARQDNYSALAVWCSRPGAA